MNKKKFKFIDLFAGIGGFHLAMESIGGECVFASELDKYARETYKSNFKDTSPKIFENNDLFFNDDIRKVSASELPDFDVLCAGFPCQPFSQAGHKRGFLDTHKSERGNLFFNIVEILEEKKPKAFFLENVRGIINHDNGKTFKKIKSVITDELGYSFNYKIVKASDYGLPQLRPRTFMIGFLNDEESTFLFPEHIPLRFNMSDVWEGECSREIGFTLRVGGRGSSINDRRNWDSYIVDNQVKKIMPKQAKRMQGFPDDFIFPVPDTQAMKQLGNSVAVDAIRECGKSLINYMFGNKSCMTEEITKKRKKNKGEWSELYSFFKLINDKKLLLSDKNLTVKNNTEHFSISKITTLNIPYNCYLDETDVVNITDEENINVKKIKVSEFINNDTLKNLVDKIHESNKKSSDSKGSSYIPEFDVIQDCLGILIVKGGRSNQKADIVLDINNSCLNKKNEGFGIKSYLGGKPTLFNASGNTNFIFEIVGMKHSMLDEVNSINSGAKLKKRINKIYSEGGSLKFHKIEKDTMSYNLNMVDSKIPELIAHMLLEFYVNRTANISENLRVVSALKLFNDQDLQSLQVKVKRLLLSILLGFFAGKKWDGKFIANGAIVVKKDGDQVGFHIIDKDSLEDYLFENTKFDTPSTGRHGFGSVILESDGKLYFKLNLQLRL